MKAVTSYLIFFIFSLNTFSFELPKDWQKWTKVLTPLTQIGALPDCDADVEALPEIYQETVFTYCEIKEGGPGKVEVLVKPSIMKDYKDRKGNFPDGINFILYLVDLKVLFTTAYKNNKPIYQVFKSNGVEIKEKNGNLSPNSCISCHTGYANFCANGQCGTLIKK